MALPTVRGPVPIESPDQQWVDSTDGNPLHRPLAETLDERAFAIEDTPGRHQGSTLLPAFVV